MGKTLRITISAAIVVLGLCAINVVSLINRSSGSHPGYFQWPAFGLGLVLAGIVYAFWRLTKPAE
jgi:hypothetical protein